MEIFKQLPLELKNYILFKCGGLQHKTSIMIKDLLNENKLWENEVFNEPNFYEFLKASNFLKPLYKMVLIFDDYGGYIHYPIDYDDDV